MGRTSTRLTGASTAEVIVLADVLAPGDGVALLVDLLHRDVHHEAVRRRAVPVLLLRLEEHTVAGADLLHRAALALTASHALGDEDRLSQRMGVPRGPRGGREVDDRRREPVSAGRLGDRVDVDLPGEPLGGSLAGRHRASRDLHLFTTTSIASLSLLDRTLGWHDGRSG